MGTGCRVLHGQVKFWPAIKSRGVGVLLGHAGVLWASGRPLVCWAYSQWQKLLNSARGGDITGPGIYGNQSPCLIKLGFPGGGGIGLEHQLASRSWGSAPCISGARNLPSLALQDPSSRARSCRVGHSSTSPPALGNLPHTSAFRGCSVTSDLVRLENRVGASWAGLHPQD